MAWRLTACTYEGSRREHPNLAARRLGAATPARAVGAAASSLKPYHDRALRVRQPLQGIAESIEQLRRLVGRDLVHLLHGLGRLRALGLEHGGRAEWRRPLAQPLFVVRRWPNDQE